MKAKEGGRQCRAEKRAGNGNRSVQVKMAQIIGRRMSEKMCGRLACYGMERGKQEVGRPSIFVVEAVHAIYCIGSRLRKTRRISRWEPFWACDVLGLQKVVKERVGGGRRGSAADFVAFNCKG